ncbi:MAG: YkoF family thiamine/hydroxymethylpyrimidine-binding protein [Kangiellaceae bacterium]
MKISAEISLYPLEPEYLIIIKDIVERLNKDPRVTCYTNTMSSQIFGDFDDVMDVVIETLKYSFNQYGRQVLVAKFLNGDFEPVNPQQ